MTLSGNSKPISKTTQKHTNKRQNNLSELNGCQEVFEQYSTQQQQQNSMKKNLSLKPVIEFNRKEKKRKTDYKYQTKQTKT